MGRVYSSRADDRVGFNWVHDDGTPGQVEINWCEPSKRKSVIEFQAKFEYADVRVDNSAVEIVWHANSPVSPELRAKINVPVKPKNVGFYLRGEEFSLELEEFLGACVDRNLHVDETVSNDITALLKDGYEVDQLIDKIACKVGLK